ncbi:uncharacterized protein LOC132560817 [Ylistrum balloti]|uniref:uncharacterized protein LOC132560817 n=1 Tax=Ylistrum balloti TaxID=509963 RepID=UPI002905B7EB|nr:uncharacterized protein LOC132560817 [Ylistrum balloti]
MADANTKGDEDLKVTLQKMPENKLKIAKFFLPLLMVIACTLLWLCWCQKVTFIQSGHFLSERIFFEESENKSLKYSIRYPVKTCDTNMTYVDFSDSLTVKESARVKECIDTFETDMLRGRGEEDAFRSKRWSIHNYLTRDSLVIDAGGHIGLDVEEFNTRFHPGTYIILEPIEMFYNMLKVKFRTFSNIIIYKFGIDAFDGTFYVDEKNDGSSIFFKDKNATSVKQAAKIVNAKRFFEKLSVRSRDVDLITMNCEGCEYAVLDLLLATDYIHHFRNIQFQPHRIPRICYPIKRYCWYQELFQKTHKLSYQFKFVWESWRRI